MSRSNLVLGRALADELMADGEFERLKAQHNLVQMRIEAIDAGQTPDGFTCAVCGGDMCDGGASGICCPECH